jgi:hypothetical protein
MSLLGCSKPCMAMSFVGAPFLSIFFMQFSNSNEVDDRRKKITKLIFDVFLIFGGCFSFAKFFFGGCFVSKLSFFYS